MRHGFTTSETLTSYRSAKIKLSFSRSVGRDARDQQRQWICGSQQGISYAALGLCVSAVCGNRMLFGSAGARARVIRVGRLTSFSLFFLFVSWSRAAVAAALISLIHQTYLGVSATWTNYLERSSNIFFSLFSYYYKFSSSLPHNAAQQPRVFLSFFFIFLLASLKTSRHCHLAQIIHYMARLQKLTQPRKTSFSFFCSFIISLELVVTLSSVYLCIANSIIVAKANRECQDRRAEERDEKVKH